ncbi:hypothetical protein Q3C01_15965 [Bradyrhizobium sp. UFLA05-109]
MRFDFTALRHTSLNDCPIRSTCIAPAIVSPRLPLAIAPRLQKLYRIENSVENAK